MSGRSEREVDDPEVEVCHVGCGGEAEYTWVTDRTPGVRRWRRERLKGGKGKVGKQTSWMGRKDHRLASKLERALRWTTSRICGQWKARISASITDTKPSGWAGKGGKGRKERGWAHPILKGGENGREV